jgi:hypothetical protein
MNNTSTKHINAQGILLMALSLFIGLWFSSVCSGAEAQKESPKPKLISIRQDASPKELLAANEIRRYVYLRTGALLPVKTGVKEGDRIVVSSKESGFCGALGKELGPQQFTIKTADEGGQRVWSIVGGDEEGALYGAYRFAEALGIHFSIEGDAVPDERLSGAFPEVNETAKPQFALRGLVPFHDFHMGPDWWNLQDYENVLIQMTKMRMNFLGLHTYPSWNPSTGPEANVWTGLPEDVDAQGNVRTGYESGMVTTRKGWEVRPYPTSKYASGAGLLFEGDDYAPDFLMDYLNWPKTSEEGAAMFNQYGDFQQKAFSLARRLGVKTCVGTEIPLNVPKILAANLESKGMKADDPAVIQRLYEGTFLRIMRKMPVDYFWFWTPEIWVHTPGSPGWEITTTANVERDLGLAQAAASAVKAPFGFATSGWRLGTKTDPLWMHNRTPKSWAASSLVLGIGTYQVESSYGEMPDRPKWVMPWVEDDNTVGAQCCTAWDLQLWGQRMFQNAAVAARYGAEGLMVNHWRTACISPNLEALAQAGWRTDIAQTPVDMQVFWSEWGRGMFGGEAGAEAGRIFQKLDGSQWSINALIQNGANWKVSNNDMPGAVGTGTSQEVAKTPAKPRTTDAEVDKLFVPLEELQALRSRIKGVGNLERYDFWLNFIRASKLRTQTWILSYQLTGKVKEVEALQDAQEKARRARSELLPLRLAVVRSYEKLIATLVACAKTPGEVGTIASIESGRARLIVNGDDESITKLLGEPLPADAEISTAYRGAPRIFVSAARTLSKAGEPQELRPFVLSDVPCSSVNLNWRALGAKEFQKVEATHRARQAYRVSLPAQDQGSTVEYYLEAILKDGRTVRWPETAPAINQTVLAW